MKIQKILSLCLLVLAFSMMASAAEEEEKVSVKAYGFIKLDAIYETGNSSHGNFAMWAKNPLNNDGLFHVTARETRLGFAITGFGFGKFKVSGKLEVDFHSIGTEENKPYNYMRHGYLEISDGSFTIIAGQTWDIIAPLNPSTLNYSVMWGVGNISYRRPQLSFRKEIKGKKSVFTIHGGISRTIAADYDNDGVEDGSAAGFPTFQGRIAGKFNIGKTSSLQVGVSGHYGQSKGAVDYTTDSMNADFLLAFSKIKIAAEFFSGKNLGTFMGGIAQGVNTVTGKEIKAKGFFTNITANPTDKLALSFGLGMDDPDDETLSIGSRSKNVSYFGNAVFNLSRSAKVGFEISNWITDYKNGSRQKTVRFQNSWILTF